MDRRCSGNLIYFSAPSGETLLCLQEAPPSAERRDFETYDFRLEDGEFYSCCWGIAPEDLVPGRAVTGYRHTILFCPSGVEPERILHRYLASRFPMRSEEAAVLVNPWGCGSFPELVSANFLREEKIRGNQFRKTAAPDRKSTRLNSSHRSLSRMPSSA